MEFEFVSVWEAPFGDGVLRTFQKPLEGDTTGVQFVRVDQVKENVDHLIAKLSHPANQNDLPALVEVVALNLESLAANLKQPTGD